MKSEVRFFFLCLIFSSIAIFLSACGTPESGIPVAELNTYTIVRSRAADKDTKHLIFEMKKELADLLTADFDVQSDDEDPIEAELLVGETNRPESETLLGSLRYHDYGYAVVGKKVVIAGHTTKTLKLGIEAFVAAIRQATENGDFLQEGEYITRGVYNVEDMTFCGLPTKDLTVVYNPMEKRFGTLLAETISEKSGYPVDAISSQSKIPDQGNLVLLGVSGVRNLVIPEDLEEEETYVTSSSDAVLLAGGTFGYEQLCYSLLASVLSGNGTSVPLPSERSSDALIRSVSYNLWVGDRTEERISAVIESIQWMNPDTIGVQEGTLAWITDLRTRLPEYGIVGIPRDGKTAEGTYILYRKDKFTLVDSGTYWLSDTPETPSKYQGSIYTRTYTYAILKRNSDGKVFLHANTHLDYASPEIQRQQVAVLLKGLKRYKYPIVITGDFNCTSSSKAYSDVVSAGYRNSSDKAMFVQKGETYQNSNQAIDFCFATPERMTLLHSRVFTEKVNGRHPSDHNPVYVDFVLD